MKTMTKLILTFSSFLCCGTLFAQDHNLVYQAQTRAVDAPLVIGSETYTMARIPVVDLGTGNRYSVIFPAADGGGFFTSSNIVASHKPNNFVSNFTVDGFPAQIQVIDAVNYQITTNFISGGNDFIVTNSATVFLTIDLGETVITLTNSNVGTDPSGDPFLTNVNIGNTFNAVPAAEWTKYGDPTALLAALDKWIDYIRVITH